MRRVYDLALPPPLHPERVAIDDDAILRLRRLDAHLAVEEIALERVEVALARIAVTSRSRHVQADEIASRERQDLWTSVGVRRLCRD